ncbi:hypothetical protein [Thiohalomonas denitrificans]|nr:hypothetical protein [Thiohalomonas denitrificans]
MHECRERMDAQERPSEYNAGYESYIISRMGHQFEFPDAVKV